MLLLFNSPTAPVTTTTETLQTGTFVDWRGSPYASKRIDLWFPQRNKNKSKQRRRDV